MPRLPPLLLCFTLAVAGSAAAGPPAGFQPKDLAGTWQMDLDLANQVEVPVLGPTLVLSRKTNLVRIEVLADGSLQQEHISCGLRAISEEGIVKTRFPPGFVSALPNKVYPISVYQDDGVWRYSADLQPEHLGYDPALTGGKVPTRAADTGVVDSDGDGKPGATVLLDAPLFTGVEAYIAQHAHTYLAGRVQSADALRGRAEVRTLEQHVIGASNRLFDNDAQVRPRPERSSFRLFRIGDGSSCADLI